MTRTKSIIGALALCAVSICAFAAASASASELTAVTCKKEGLGNTNSHCATGTEGEYKTVAIPKDTTTAIEGTTTGGEKPTLRGTVGGLNVTISCETGHLTEAWVENKETSAGKHEAIGGGMLTYTNCEAMLKSKESRTCKVEEITGGGVEKGMIATTTLKSNTTGTEHQVLFQPASGTIFSEFNILPEGTECPFGAKVKVTVEGSVECEANTETHSHLTCTEANNGTALKANGGAAKYIDTVGANMVGEPETTVGATTFT
jgi:hypothetical protein